MTSPARARLARAASALALTLALATIACGPLVMIPGGQLSGTEQSAPSDWSFTDAVDTVQLETRPSDPYSVNVWGVAARGAFYIAGDRSNAWARHIAADPRVRLKVGDRLYPLRAAETADDAEIEDVLAALQRKYDFSPDPEQRTKAALFRLSAR